MSNLGLELFEYIEELYCITRVCERPAPDGEKCVQCRERERIIERLKAMLLRHYEKTPYYSQIAGQWTRAERQQASSEKGPDVHSS